MSIFFARRFRGLCVLITVIALCGCQAHQQQQSQRQTTIPKTVFTKAQEQQDTRVKKQIASIQNAPDPMQQHLKARAAVDPQRVSKENRYTLNVKKPHTPKEAAHFRALQLQAQSPGGLYAGLETAAGASSAVVSGIIPPRKPQRFAKAVIRSQPKPQPKPVASSFAFSPAPSPPLGAAVPKPRRKVLASLTPSSNAGGGSAVTGFRTGEHPGRTRVVLDVDGIPKFKTAFQRNNSVLVVNLPGSAWRTIAKRQFFSHPLIKTYETKPDGRGGANLILNLKRPGKLLMKTAMPPNQVYNTHRIVLDLAAL